MANVFEAGEENSSQLHAALSAGLEVLSEGETISFQSYIRQVLPIDGFVFWVNSTILSPVQLDAVGLSSSAPVSVSGSVHFTTAGTQALDESIAVHKMIFTAESQITALAEIAPTVIWIGTWQGKFGTFQFSFSGRNAYYQDADLHHYVGDAIYPALQSQIIDTIDQFSEKSVVSNSLPFWLQLASATTLPKPLVYLNFSLPLFPSFLVPDNIRPPYGVIHIDPNRTITPQPTPFIDSTGNHWQLALDRVRIILYGLRNHESLLFQDMIFAYSRLMSDVFGITNSPIMRDEKRTQQELAVIAMKKSIDFDISYNQQSSRTIAFQLLKTIVPSFFPSDQPLESYVAQYMSPTLSN